MGSTISRKKEGSPVAARTPSDGRKLLHRLTLEKVKWNPKRSSSTSAVNLSDKAEKNDRKWKSPSVQLCKSLIGNPSNFQHLGHMGGGEYRTGAINPMPMHEIASPAMIPTDQPELTIPFLKSLNEVQRRPPTPPILTLMPLPELNELSPVSDVLSPPPRSLRDRELAAEEAQRYAPKSPRRRTRRPFSYDPSMVTRSAQLPTPPPMDREPNISATDRVPPTSFKRDSLTLGKPRQVPLKDCSSNPESRIHRRHSGPTLPPSPTRLASNRSIVAIGQPIWDPKQINSVWNERSVSAPSTMRRSMQDDFLRRSLNEDSDLTGLGLEPRSNKFRDAARRYASRSNGSLGLDLETSALFGLHGSSNNSAHSLGQKSF